MDEVVHYIERFQPKLTLIESTVLPLTTSKIYEKTRKPIYKSLGFKTRICKSSLETEFMKIINTTYYGLMIAWFQEVDRLCEKFKLNKEKVIDFIGLTERESGGKLPRPIFYPGYMGGHCVIPNVLLLKEVYPSIFIEALLDSNERKATIPARKARC